MGTYRTYMYKKVTTISWYLMWLVLFIRTRCLRLRVIQPPPPLELGLVRIQRHEANITRTVLRHLQRWRVQARFLHHGGSMSRRLNWHELPRSTLLTHWSQRHSGQVGVESGSITTSDSGHSGGWNWWEVLASTSTLWRISSKVLILWLKALRVPGQVLWWSHGSMNGVQWEQ